VYFAVISIRHAYGMKATTLENDSLGLGREFER
jgi:hypothetical protein